MIADDPKIDRKCYEAEGNCLGLFQNLLDRPPRHDKSAGRVHTSERKL